MKNPMYAALAATFVLFHGQFAYAENAATGEEESDEALIDGLLSDDSLATTPEPKDSTDPTETKDVNQAQSGSVEAAEQDPQELDVIPVHTSEAEPRSDLKEARRASSIAEIVVMAQKRDQYISEVPMSISALSGEQLEKLGAENLRDIAAVTPSFQVVEAGPGVQHMQMRGISSAHGQATVGYQLDNISLASFSLTQPDAVTFDLQSVEILRGPQGTLYGEGSMGGTVKLITQKPRLGEWGLVAKADAALTDGGAPSVEGNAMVNAPIGESAALRIVGGVSDLGGFIDQVELGQDNHNHAKKENARARLTWEPSDSFTVGLLGLYQSIDAGSANAADDSYKKYDQVDVGIDDKGTIASVDLNWHPGTVNVFATASKFKRDNSVVFDSRDSVLAEIPPTGLPVIDNLSRDLASRLIKGAPGGYEVSTASEMAEIRLSSTDGPFVWTAGVYARQLDQILNLNASIQLDASLIPRLPGIPLDPTSLLPSVSVVDVTTNTDSLATAVFGQIEYDWTDWLNTAVGARYFEEKLHIVNTGRSLMVQPADSDDRLRYNSFTPRAVMSFKLPDGLFGVLGRSLLYFSYAEGFRSGGANIQASPEIPPTYLPDTLVTYEIGTKLEFWDRLLTAEVAIYFNQWDHVQVVVVPEGGTGSFTAIQNEGSAEGRGIDWNFVLAPTESLSFYHSGAYIDTSFVTDSDGKRAGDPIDFVSPLTLAVGGSYGFTWPGGHPGSIRLDYSYSDRSRYQRQGSFDRYSDPVNMLNARLSYETESAEFSLYGRNLLDNEGALDANSPERQARARPPTYGVEMKVTF